MRFRTVLQEFEAYFHSVQPGSNVHGKSEWKQYGDGTYRFKISIRDIPLPDGRETDLWRDGQWILRLSVSDNPSGFALITRGQILQMILAE